MYVQFPRIFLNIYFTSKKCTSFAGFVKNVYAYILLHTMGAYLHSLIHIIQYEYCNPKLRINCTHSVIRELMSYDTTRYFIVSREIRVGTCTSAFSD